MKGAGARSSLPAATADLTASSEPLRQVVSICSIIRSGRIPTFAPSVYDADGALSGEVRRPDRGCDCGVYN